MRRLKEHASVRIGYSSRCVACYRACKHRSPCISEEEEKLKVPLDNRNLAVSECIEA